MHTYLLDLLQCPVCSSDLDWQIDDQAGDRIETAESHCTGCTASYPVREGIGLFLTPDLPRNDLWEQVDSGLIKHLRQHPELERQLMDSPLESLNPADQFFRALLLEANGDFIEAQKTVETAFSGLYTPAYKTCWDNQVTYLLDKVSATRGPIVDLASGRGYLVEKLVRQFNRPVVATDFSPAVLRRNRSWLQTIGLYEQVSLLAFDARRTPFKDKAVTTMTTNLGLPNIEEPATLLQELGRIVRDTFLSISYFFPEADEANRKVIQEAKLETMLYRNPTLAHFAEAGWEAALENSCLGDARPTPASVILDGARIDGLPAADTTLEWGLLTAVPAGN